MQENKKNFSGPENESEHVNEIYCDVKNCVYHDGEKVCTAGGITVGPHFAVSSNDTICATFKGK